MKRLLAVLSALVLGACAARTPDPRPLTDGTPLERHVLRYNRDVAGINASVGAPPIAYTLDRADDLRAYEAIVSARYEHDLRSVYGNRLLRPATQIFLLLGAQADHDHVELIRIGSTSADGAFERLEGLTYAFDPQTRALLDVIGTEY